MVELSEHSVNYRFYPGGWQHYPESTRFTVGNIPGPYSNKALLTFTEKRDGKPYDNMKDRDR